ncbi:zinc-binding dehydrogenase [Corallococcus sp. H22C18031201]|uniref:glucose 1-dehydrogenase n=1 Tax=Citreicoccus inhibens TaxID=2849499 RepID=UPI000E709755|nr:glucose 1-dehydrogenase [Citreicoccus inhibens]MBU8900585.1 glucose 1-dehydrogenase [Citreicoccus inhibens]RJS23313.1 zinc-binding dehydrogenase [Corallococcus sp. H22C18031201]
MRAVAVFPKVREVRVINLPEPPPVTGSHVLLKVLEVGICGTDREIGAFEYGAPPPGSDHLILGHEALAEVVATGPDVTWVRKGDLVVPTVRRPCPQARCRPCRAERQDFCVTGEFWERGIKEAHGFLQEWTVEEEAHLVAVPRKLADVAVLTEPLSVAAKAAEQAQALQGRLPWERAHVRALALGAGPVGLLGAMSMVVNHFDTFVYSLEPAASERAELVRSFGATYLSGQDVPLGELRQKVGTFDIIYEAVGVSKVAFAAVDALGANGLFIFTGIPAHGSPSPVDTDTLMRNIVLRNQLLLGTVNASRSAYELALRELEQAMFLFPRSVRALITHRVPIEAAPALITGHGGVKQVIALSSAGTP